jgi:anthranilate phosphoribosyltransferase
MTDEHPFARFIRIIGRGPRLSRPLAEEEMYDAARMIMAGEAHPLQLGAFLCILRVRAEDPAEGAGFVRAVRDVMNHPAALPAVDLDWPSYSGKVRHNPWFLLAVLALVNHGVRILIHGAEGHTAGRLYTRPVLEGLGFAPAGSVDEAADQITARGLAYLPLRHIHPVLQEIMDMKAILGVRTPINTFARMINPFDATHEIQTVFHPAYRDIHRHTARLLGRRNMAVFKGEGGEAERRPQKPVLVESLDNGQTRETTWPALLGDAGRYREEKDLGIERLRAVWSGKAGDDYASAAITGTLAIVLRLMHRAETVAQAHDLAETVWGERDASFLDR